MEALNTFSQVMIFIMGAAAIWFVSRKEDWKRWGYIIGLASQPFWLFTSFTTKQWGIFALSIWYAYSWGMGVYNYWIKPEKKKKAV